MGDARRIPEWVPSVTVVAGCGDDERALANRLEDRLLDHELVLVGAEAEVDDLGTAVRRRQDSLHDLARLERGALPLGGIPGAEYRLGIDADETEAVVRRRDEGPDRGSVLAADSLGLLRIQRLRIGAAEELRVRDVDAGIDDRHGPPGGRRREGVDADRGAPPLGRNERVGEVVDRQRARGPVGRAQTEGPQGSEGDDDSPGGRVRDDVEAERRRDERAAGAGHEDGVGTARGRAQLHERRTRRSACSGGRRAGEDGCESGGRDEGDETHCLSCTRSGDPWMYDVFKVGL